MCGIAGVIGRPELPDAVVQAMLRAMQHRGPDGSGMWADRIFDARALVLGHRRLSILDLSDAGARPMVDVSGRFVLIHNGEIYNFLEVRAELQALGVTFRSESDTEVIIEAYRQWGKDCLSRFNGMFAFVLYDRAAGVLFCARDRYGEKPLLFAFVAALYYDQGLEQGAGKDIFDKSVSAMTALAGGIIGYLFGSRGSGTGA